jgi:hypothetical protein
MRTLKARSGRVAIASVLLIGIALAGCREEEQDRVLLYDKGIYLGEPDTALTEQQVDALRQRATNQGPVG